MFIQENVQVFNGHKLCKGIGVVFNCLIGRSFHKNEPLVNWKSEETEESEPPPRFVKALQK